MDSLFYAKLSDAYLVFLVSDFFLFLGNLSFMRFFSSSNSL